MYSSGLGGPLPDDVEAYLQDGERRRRERKRCEEEVHLEELRAQRLARDNAKPSDKEPRNWSDVSAADFGKALFDEFGSSMGL